MKTAPAHDDGWQRIWLSARKENWTSLALIPSDNGIDVTAVAEALVSTGRQYGEKPVGLLNAKGTLPTGVRQLLDTLNTMIEHGASVIVPVDPIGQNPSSVAVVQATSAALLVVRLGQSLITSARDTIEVIGRPRFLGSIVLDSRAGRPHPSLHLAPP